MKEWSMLRLLPEDAKKIDVNCFDATRAIRVVFSRLLTDVLTNCYDPIITASRREVLSESRARRVDVGMTSYQRNVDLFSLSS
jgi:hypothetical protein